MCDLESVDDSLSAGEELGLVLFESIVADVERDLGFAAVPDVLVGMGLALAGTLSTYGPKASASTFFRMLAEATDLAEATHANTMN